jgi:uncharacterized protein (DUF433 family)
MLMVPDYCVRKTAVIIALTWEIAQGKACMHEAGAILAPRTTAGNVRMVGKSFDHAATYAHQPKGLIRGQKCQAWRQTTREHSRTTSFVTIRFVPENRVFATLRITMRAIVESIRLYDAKEPLLQAFPDLTPEEVDAAIVYYVEHPTEIEGYILEYVDAERNLRVVRAVTVFLNRVKKVIDNA